MMPLQNNGHNNTVRIITMIKSNNYAGLIKLLGTGKPKPKPKPMMTNKPMPAGSTKPLATNKPMTGTALATNKPMPAGSTKPLTLPGFKPGNAPVKPPTSTKKPGNIVGFGGIGNKEVMPAYRNTGITLK